VGVRFRGGGRKPIPAS